ncbi:hypothetical protein VitviT2T_000694 [Vitis vinifera]|uniref:C2H2-type domain-containing protein n=1 Tax=Vitis vinifera TaxID=29760 RepID=A0ABY9BD93_VITVI|nr:uncharacterized protein LOC104879713 [Vitis vinifera]WJZ80808.1 hypothetical protein VitviT2T_000694 [Vitis vinifera]|eukprot:XP_010651783.1 PREDICTED: prothymosin alpha-B-like [Vitis vinifera]
MEHIEFLNPNNRYKCLKCGDEFQNSNGIKHYNSDRHRKWHHVCSKCYNAFARKINLLEHRSKNIHGINVADEEEEEAEEEDDEGGNEVEDDDGNEGGNEVEVEDDSDVDEGGENAEHGDEEEADGGENGEDDDGNEVG